MIDALTNIGAAIAKRSGAEHGLRVLQPHLDRADRVVHAASLTAVSQRNNPVVQTLGAPASANTRRAQQGAQDMPLVQEPTVGHRLTSAPATDPRSAAVSSRPISFGASSTAPQRSSTLPGSASLSTNTPAVPQERPAAAVRAPQDRITGQPPVRPPQDQFRAPQPPIQEHISPPYPTHLATTGLADPQTMIAAPPPAPFAPIDDASRSQSTMAGNTDLQLEPAQGRAGQVATRASSRWQPSGPDDPALPSTSSQSSPTGEAEGQSEGRLILDNALLGRWVIDHISHAADRPATGSTAFDPRISRTWPGALQSL